MKEEKTKSKTWAVALIYVAVVALLIGGIMLLLNGTTTTSGKNPEAEVSQALTCTTGDLDYALLKTVTADSKSGKVAMIFEEDGVRSASLVATLYYGSETAVSQGEALSHAAMNTAFSADGLGPDALGATYAKLQDRMQMSLYADGAELNKTTARYFMMDTIPETIASAKSLYEAQGFSCTVK